MEVGAMIGVKLNPAAFLQHVADLTRKLDAAQVQALGDAVAECYSRDATVFIIGNGGSGSNASHLAEDLAKGSLRRADFDDPTVRRLRVISLTDCTPAILAWGNDEGYDRIFLEQLKNLARPGDLLIAISGSGNSPNILRAVEWSNSRGVKTFGITGYDGGKLKGMAGGGLHVDSWDMGVVESLHLIAFHWVVDDMHRRIGLRDVPQSEVVVDARLGV
jgi:D-sedoheptulose 7-phosphate isomerase